jgi:hypothetical protein
MSFSARRQIVLAAAIGNIVEWYDFGLYGLMAPVLASRFFPSQDRIAALLGVYGGFAVGFAMRPIAVVLGRLGDRRASCKRPIEFFFSGASDGRAVSSSTSSGGRCCRSRYPTRARTPPKRNGIRHSSSNWPPHVSVSLPQQPAACQSYEPTNSPPTENPWNSRRAIKSIGAHIPITSYDGNKPTAAVEAPMSATERQNGCCSPLVTAFPIT